MIKLATFPYLFVRYAGLDKSLACDMLFADIDRYYSSYREVLISTDTAKGIICSHLYDLIEQQENEAQRNVLLTLKRSIYNDRPSVYKDFDQISELIKKDIQVYFENYLKATERLQQIVLQFSKDIKESLVDQRKHIQDIAASEPFRKGVLLSSEVLYKQLHSFRRANPQHFNKGELRNEFSILRYITRMMYKTSPFSTFTYTGLVKLNQGRDIEQVPEPHCVQSRIRLNNKVLRELKSIMMQHPLLNEGMIITLNSTIKLEAGEFIFLMNYVNLEIFQRIPATGVNKFIYERLVDSNNITSFADLIVILEEHVESDRVQIKSYLLNLIATGMLELGTQSSELDTHWDSALAKFLDSRYQSAEASLLRELLGKLQSAKCIFETAPSEERELILSDTDLAMMEAFEQLRAQAGITKRTPSDTDQLIKSTLATYKAGGMFLMPPYIPMKFKRENIFYEDCYISQVSHMSQKDVDDLVCDLDELCCCLNATDSLAAERRLIRDFFLKTYPEGSHVPVLIFYGAYARYKERLNSQEPIQTYSKDEALWSQKIDEILLDKNTATDQIDFTTGDFKSVFNSDEQRKESRSVFIQFYYDRTGSLKGVVNKLMWGMGKLSGRFLYLFDDAVTVTHKQWNTGVGPDVMQMELSDNSNFNANLHPPLLDWEIKMPGSHTRMSHEKQIPISSLVITCDYLEQRPRLIHGSSGSEVDAFDLSLESFYNRSNLYKLLAHFNRIPYVSLSALIHKVDKINDRNAADKSDNIILKPRIVFKGRLIIRRKGWLIPINNIPEQLPQEELGTYLLKLKLWLEENRLPHEVFLFLRVSPLSTPEMRTNGKRDDYKPQYINFHQPLLVLLFIKLLRRAGDLIYFEEVLPAVTGEGAPIRTNEHLVQWYKI